MVNVLLHLSYAEQLGLHYTLPAYLQEVYMQFPLDRARI